MCNLFWCIHFLVFQQLISVVTDWASIKGTPTAVQRTKLIKPSIKVCSFHHTDLEFSWNKTVTIIFLIMLHVLYLSQCYPRSKCKRNRCSKNLCMLICDSWEFMLMYDVMAILLHNFQWYGSSVGSISIKSLSGSLSSTCHLWGQISCWLNLVYCYP